jgi:hypothetical protein
VLSLVALNLITIATLSSPSAGAKIPAAIIEMFNKSVADGAEDRRGHWITMGSSLISRCKDCVNAEILGALSMALISYRNNY